MILGGGFAGLYAARRLERRAGAGHRGGPAEPPPVPADAVPGRDRRRSTRPTSPRPSAPCFGSRRTPRCCWPRRLRDRRRRPGRCTSPTVTSLTYDYLIVATGARHSYFGHDEWEPLAPGLKSLDDALEIRRRVLLAFERPSARPTRCAATPFSPSSSWAAARPAWRWPARSRRSGATPCAATSGTSIRREATVHAARGRAASAALLSARAERRGQGRSCGSSASRCAPRPW